MTTLCDRVVYIHPTKVVPPAFCNDCGHLWTEHRRMPTENIDPNMVYLVLPGSIQHHVEELG